MYLDKKELLLRVNEESKVQIDRYSPEKPKDILVEWHSLDSNRAIVSNGIVRGVSPGETYVYATVNGVESIACKVIINGVYDEDNDIYILGSNRKMLMYWKNGFPTQITEAKNRIIGKAIEVHHDNVYAAARVIRLQNTG